jgi:hypothetical protein
MDEELNPVTIALQLAPQLPEDFAIAGKVLAHLDELRHWRAGKPQGDHEVLLFRREGVGGPSGNSPSLCPKLLDKPSVLP